MAPTHVMSMLSATTLKVAITVHVSSDTLEMASTAQVCIHIELCCHMYVYMFFQTLMNVKTIHVMMMRSAPTLMGVSIVIVMKGTQAMGHTAEVCE